MERRFNLGLQMEDKGLNVVFAEHPDVSGKPLQLQEGKETAEEAVVPLHCSGALAFCLAGELETVDEIV